MHYLSLKLSKLNILAVLILTLFFPARNIKADYIYLKAGPIISGVLIEEKVNLLIYRVPYGEMFINRENISKIIREGKDKPLVREAKKYLNDKKFKRAIKTAGEALEIKPDSREALEIKQKAVAGWRKEEAKKEEKRQQIARELKNMQAALKTKWRFAIKKENSNYIIDDIYPNCPLLKREIKPGDILVAIQNTKVVRLSIKEVYDLLLKLEEINLAIHRPVVLAREKISWDGKECVSVGIYTAEKVDNGLKITNLMPDSPAVKIGILKNDIIISLKGQSISFSSMDEIIKLLKGSAGTKLNATILREVTLD